MPSLPWGLTPYGFRAKTLEDIQAGLEGELRDKIRDAEGRPNLNTKAGPIHQVIGTVASAAREVWELAEAVHAATDPDRATGAALATVCAITGTEPIGATRSRVTAIVALGMGVTLPAGSIASVDGTPTARFVTIAPVTATSAGNYEVLLDGETPGPIGANAGTLTVIETPVSGWSAITNPLDAVLGTLEETSAELRARRERELDAQGTSPRDAIRADLLRLLIQHGITNGSASVFMNTGDVTDGDGLPPHSVETIVYDGTDDGSALSDDAIAQLLWDTVAAGIQTYGTSTGTAIDAVGIEHQVAFTRPTVIPIYVATSTNVATSRGWDAVGGEDAIKEAIATRGDAEFGVGDDVIRFKLLSAVFGVPGVIDVTAFTLGTSINPVGTSNLVIGRRQIAAFDTSRVAVTATPVSPP